MVRGGVLVSRVQTGKIKKGQKISNPLILNRRGGRIRTCDPLVPNHKHVVFICFYVYSNIIKYADIQ